MNVIKENIDNLNACIKVRVVQMDYTEKVEKVLRDYRKKATFDGFRPGKVPFRTCFKTISQAGTGR